MTVFLNIIIAAFLINLIAFTAGSFIYIASSDLIPEIKTFDAAKKNASHLFVFLLGITLMWFLKLLE